MIDTNEAIVGTLLSFLATAILYLNNRGKFNAQSVRQDEVITDFAVSFKNELDVARKEADAARARHNEQLAFRDAIIQQERDTANAERADWKMQTEQWAEERAKWKLQTEEWAEERGHWAEEREAREAALSAIRVQLTESNALVTQYKAENQALLTSVEGMRQELVAINQERNSERTSLQTQLETANNRVNELERQIKVDNEKFSKSLNGLMNEISGLQTANTELTKALAEAGQEKSDDRVTHLQEQVANLESHRQEAVNAAGDKAQIAELKAEIKELKHPTTEAPTVASETTPLSTNAPVAGDIVGTIPVYKTGPLVETPPNENGDDETL